jgi:thiamine pyrophosphate-dependent acetolactate synthase large subunit-like protein
MKVFERIAAGFVAEGVSSVFTLMGDGNLHWLEAVDALGIDVFHARHEGAALSMADGWSRVARERGVDIPGICSVTHGPGVAQFGSNMLVAARAQSPLVAFVGEGPEGDHEFVQRLDQSKFADAVEAVYIKVVSAETTDQAVRKAFYISKVESRPVILSASVATQTAEFEEYAPYVATNEFIERDRIYPHPDAIRRIAALLTNSSRPVFVVGRGAMWSDAEEAIRTLAERCGAIIATSLLAKGWLSDDEFNVGIAGLYSSKAAIELFQTADCVVAFGASMNKYTTVYGHLFADAQVIQIDDRSYPPIDRLGPSDIHLQADAALAAQALEEQLSEQRYKQEGFRQGEVRERLIEAYQDPEAFDIEPGRLDPRRVCTQLDELLPSEVALMLGNGHQVGFGTMLFRRARSLTVSNLHFGCVGPALSTSIGAVVASDRQPTVLVEGDGGLMMFLGELDTMVRYRLPLLVVVMNDEGFGAEYHKMKASSMNKELAVFGSPDFGAVARSLGARGTRVETHEQLESAAREFLASPGPMVIDVPISRNVLSIPYRRLHYGMDV